MRKMTMREAQKMADTLWGGDGVAVGIARWRRKHSPRFRVGVAFTDGRLPEIKGESNVDWDTAFAIATGALK